MEEVEIIFGEDRQSINYIPILLFSDIVLTELYLYIRVIRVLLAQLLQFIAESFAESLVFQVENIQLLGDAVGSSCWIVGFSDTPIQTRMVLLEIALEPLQSEIVYLAMLG